MTDQWEAAQRRAGRARDVALARKRAASANGTVPQSGYRWCPTCRFYVLPGHAVHRPTP